MNDKLIALWWQYLICSPTNDKIIFMKFFKHRKKVLKSGYRMNFNQVPNIGQLKSRIACEITILMKGAIIKTQ